jgi:hypothetical protein
VLFSTRMTDEDIFIAGASICFTSSIREGWNNDVLALHIALDMYNDGGYKLSERNCQDFVVSLVEKCCKNSSIRAGRWCNNGCRDPVACLNAQSRHYYDKNHSKLKDLARAISSFGRIISPLDVATYLRSNDPDCNMYKARPDFRLKVVWRHISQFSTRFQDVVRP